MHKFNTSSSFLHFLNELWEYTEQKIPLTLINITTVNSSKIYFNHMSIKTEFTVPKMW
jgi:hypothetical protein